MGRVARDWSPPAGKERQSDEAGMLAAGSTLTLVDCRKHMEETGVLPQLNPGGLGEYGCGVE